MNVGFRTVAFEHGVEELELASNGLRVLLLQDDSVPVVASCLVYHVGSRNEGTGHTGSTHLLEHLLFKGSRKFNPELGTPVARTLERVGATFNATTWFDRTNYYETLPPEHLSLALEVEADRMRHALLREEDLLSELQVVRNELERGENDPLDVLLKESFATAFREHPYRHPTIGWRSDVENASIERLRTFYDTFYYPDNATLALVGAVERDQALALVERHFGELPRGGVRRPEVLSVEPRQEGERRFVVRRAGEVGWVGCSWHTPEASHVDTHALAVAADTLTAGVTSRLFQRLVETGKCLDVQALAWQLRDPGLFQVFACLNPPTGHAEVEAVIRDAVGELARTAVEADELARAKVQVEAETAFHRDSPGQVAAALTEAISSGDWRLYFEYLDRVRAVTADDITRVAAATFVDDRLSVGHFVPTDEPGSGVAPAVTVPRPAPCHYRRGLAEQVEQHELPGGARVLLLPRKGNCTVHLQGSLLAGHGGLEMASWSAASVLPDMLERGTAGYSRVALARAQEDRAIHLDIAAESFAPLEVGISGRCLSRHLASLLELLVEMLRRPTFPAQELEKVRQLRLGELAQANEDTFQRAFESFSRLAFPPGHPCYRRPLEARRQALQALRRDEVAGLHARLYGPATLVLALVGDLEPRTVLERLGGLFDGWQGGLAVPPEIPRLSPRAATFGTVRESIADRPNLDVVLGCPGGLRRRDGDFVAAMLGNAVLGHSTLSSRLGRRLRDEAGLTYGVVSRFFGTSFVDGPWATTFTVCPANLERGVELARDTIERYVATGPEDAELADEKAAMAGSLRVALATPAGQAREIARLARHGLPLTELDELGDRVLRTPREAVAASVRDHVDPARLSLAVAGELVASAGREG